LRVSSRHPIGSTILAGIVLTLIGGAVAVWSPPLADSIEGKIYDSFLRSAPRRPAPGPIAIVDLDEASLERFGQWPWPRYRIARLLDRIREAGASAVGLDMVFAEPDRTSLTPLSGEILRDLGTRIDLSAFPREALDTDRALAATLAGGPFVLGYQFDFETARGDACVLHPLRAAVLASGRKEGAEGLFDAQGVVCNLPILSTAAGSSGFFNVTPDPDGVLRRVPLVIRHKGMLYPALALAAYLRARGGDVVLETGTEGVEALRLGGRRIPLDGHGNLLLNFRGRHRTFPHLSAAAVLEGTANPALLKGRIVLLGTTAAGLKEIRTTPLDAAQPGVEIHATVLDNLLSGDPITAPRWARVLRVLLVLVPGFLLTGLLANVADNVRRFVDDIRLYEAGKAFGASYVDGHFEESRLGVILCGKRLPGDWSGANAPADFFDLKGVVEPLLLHLSPSPVHVVPSRTRMFFEEGKSADILRDGEVVGWFGAIRRELLASFDLTGAVFYGEIRLRQATASPPPRQYRALPKFPPVFRDVACVFPIDVPVGDVLAMVRAVSPEVEESSVFDVFTGEKIGDGSKSVGIRVKLQPLDRTLTEAEVHSIHSKIVNLLENRFGGKIRTS